MNLKLLCITHLYPSTVRRTIGTFNKSRIDHLSAKVKLILLVPILWKNLIKSSPKDCEPIHTSYIKSYVTYFYIPYIFKSLDGIFYFISIIAQRLFWLIKNKPDCIFASWAYPDGFASTIIARIFDIPIVLSIEGSDINILPNHMLRKLQIKWALRYSNHVISVSSDLKAKAAALGIDAKKISIVYNGVDKKYFYMIPREDARKSLGIAPNLKIILYVGNLLQTKGCLDLLEAFKVVRGARCDIKLIYVGSGSDKKLLIKKTADYRLSKHVSFSGPINHEKINNWINSSDLVCLPSYNEGTPNILLEAMSCGIPVVATKVGGIPEIVNKNTGVLTNPGDIKTISDAIKSVLDKQWDRNLIIAESHNYSWEYNAEKIAGIIEEVIKRHHSVSHRDCSRK